MVGLEYMNGPFVKMAAVTILEEDLWIELVCSIDSLQIHHCLCTVIPVHIPICCIVYYLVFRNVVVKILGVVFFLMNYHRIIYGEYEICVSEGCYLSGLDPPRPVSIESFIIIYH